ncbi:hypothetical protein IW140_004008 [Coemansia sp. RSA 1813]|nr:hypothetical protein EV178_003943 [Coemansia sp. RSA 1646]KAJ1771121.1 hypothetical protein LPJ74_002614 [Coemansia sp. RSA 1843]KAJ2088489.1 hypothetical protein IW138_004177 [Coemansia sp. RSA 986]KAJ2217082.1 hypothetical protein EV179_000849 [Coemansia sp. RSA 487]KAJ2568280.1 hypothetical protein IW140_004008 [Coemansia sp. RSA 1813]
MYFSVSRSSHTRSSTAVATTPRTQPMKLVLQATTTSAASQNSVLHNSKGQIVRPCLKKRCCAKQLAGCQYRQSSAQNRARVPRFVHFSADLEQTRLFFKTESSRCASRDPTSNDYRRISDTTTTTAASPPSSPFVLMPIRGPSPSFSSFEESPVVLESIKYGNKTLVGTIKVHNVAFEKQVLVRLTQNSWKDVKDVHATFLRVITGADGSRPGIDRFRFSIPTDDSASTADGAITISMCVCYRVNGQEYWDNNKGTNYEFKLAVHCTDKSEASGLTTVVDSTSMPPASASVFPSVDSQNTSSDIVEVCKPSNNAFSYGFSSLPSIKTHTRASSPLSVNRISSTDARRYMQYSEAKFSASISKTQTHFSDAASGNAAVQETRQSTSGFAAFPVFSAAEWSSSIYSRTVSYDSLSPNRTPSPTAHSRSPLTASTVWMPYPRSPLLHC